MKYIRKNNITVENFRVMPESMLSQLKTGEWCDEKKEYKLDDITNRVYFFGDREESFAETFFGKQTLARKNGETREDWISRITALKEEGDERLEWVSLNF